MGQGEEWLSIVESKQDEWEFHNQTTACVIRLRLKDENGIQNVWMEYHQFESLIKLINKLNK